MNVLFVHAHFDDFEFTAAGTFELLRRSCAGVRRRVLVCTDGAAGHHALTREATARRRLAEQESSAQLGGYEFVQLLDSEGRPFREGRLHVSEAFLPSLWREIRNYQPDYLFCPPIPSDPLQGVHVDHLDVAEAVRSVAYLLNVPNAFSPEFPGQGSPLSIRTPVILNTYDGYMAGSHGFDLAVDIGPAVNVAADLAWCHASQIREWLPWVDRHQLTAPGDLEGWRMQYRQILERRRRGLGIQRPGCYEAFSVTAWGIIPTVETLLRDLPGVSADASRLPALEARLKAWCASSGE